MDKQLQEIPHRRRFSDGLLDNGLILRELAVVPGQVVADAGCGNGYMTMLFSQVVGPQGRVYALDLCLSTLTATFPELLPENVSLVECDMTELIPLGNASVDIVFTSTVVHSLRRDRVAGLAKEFRRVIKPGGTLGVVEMVKRESEFGPPVWQRYSPEELQRVFSMKPLKTLEVGDGFYMQLFRATAQ